MRTTHPTLISDQDRSHSSPSPKAAWSYTDLKGRLSELSAWGASARLTVACQWILESQLAGEFTAWITVGPSSFFPPDMAASGIDLEALPVVRVDSGQSAGRAADKLTRSGAFGLIIIDLSTNKNSRRKNDIPLPLQTRLLGLAGKHATALTFLTEKRTETPSLSSLISLRADVSRTRTTEGRFACNIEVIKDKRKGPGARHQELRHGPAGLR